MNYIELEIVKRLIVLGFMITWILILVRRG